jgi:hypothetical protein
MLLGTTLGTTRPYWKYNIHKLKQIFINSHSTNTFWAEHLGVGNIRALPTSSKVNRGWKSLLGDYGG